MERITYQKKKKNMGEKREILSCICISMHVQHVRLRIAVKLAVIIGKKLYDNGRNILGCKLFL